MVREYSPQTQSHPAQSYPPLQSGDRLSRPEFERRYAAAPHIKKAELIEGIVYVASPLRHEPQPDAALFIEANTSGQPRISRDGYIEVSPELIVEIAASSAAIDTGSKKQVYRRNGVLEYVIWQSYENQLEWFWLTDGEYQLVLPDPDGIIRSRVFPGLWLAVEALLRIRWRGCWRWCRKGCDRQHMKRLWSGWRIRRRILIKNLELSEHF